ncbi:sigma-54-dependent transcriptional regulator [Carboxylicivirga marina]|uniref:sigma-54-dependent transcriptional regulator n=1 Tax=Carboxylicivirga marina TaxID=2800988 RepID=UPI002591F0FC|nr:sigma-54 dependent transcriptional regulator [uncultured Carboxylicivirga sp.]
MKSLRILIIDDEKLIRWSFEKQLESKGYEVLTAESAEEGFELFKRKGADLIFLDNHMSGMHGIELIPMLRSVDELVGIVFMTAYGTIDMAVEAIKSGASEYVSKPFNFDEINVIIDSFKKKLSLDNELQVFRRQQKEDFTFQNIIHASPKIKEIINVSRKLAQTDATSILILGESGTGKDVFARSIHNESKRKDKPFVTIVCSSLPDALLESELYGHEKGAFTGATGMKKGLFEIAEGGTVFLDEIGEINQEVQVKLLNVLENRVVRRVGGSRDIQIDVRIIAATNRNLKEAVEKGTFRRDLYYRLKVFQFMLPPLRERSEDVSVLLDYFLLFFNQQFSKKILGIDEEAKQLLVNYSWPGNVRELRNVAERAVILESGEVLKKDCLPMEIRQEELASEPENGVGLSEYSVLVDLNKGPISLDDLEKEVLQKALLMTNSNQTKASELLGISRDTLRYKKKKYKI